MDPHTWLIYFAAALGLAVSPGPNSLLVLTHGACTAGARALATVLGGTLGLRPRDRPVHLRHRRAAGEFGGAGLAVLEVDGRRLPGVAGRAGVARAADRVAHARRPGRCAPARAVPRCSPGLLAASTNPKGILFFVAFLPQFIDPARSLGLGSSSSWRGTFAVISRSSPR
jgi:threonine/homoserine/homoserine lactone efflux protein